jgi:hypothetical protein
MTATFHATLVSACLTVAIAPPAATASEPQSLATVLARAGAYVAEFHRQLSTIVGEERYVQDWKAVQSGRRPVATELQHRELVSDVVLVKPPRADAWMTFRDVFEVDGNAVRDRDDRLAQLVRSGSPSTNDAVRTILDESSRYNIGDIRRNVNTPTYPLLFLETANHFRFKFKQTKDRRPRTEPENPARDGAFRVSTEVWVIAYEEKEAGTLIKTDGHKDLPAKGRFWIEPATGRVLMSELLVSNRKLRATIDVSYQSEPILGLLVPIEMREWYDNMKTRSHIEAVATYGKFRQFQVNTDQTFLIKQ